MKKIAQILICAGLVFFLALNGRAQNLFVTCMGSNNIIEVTSNGTTSVFASGFNQPWGLAFNGAGDLFVADYGSGNIVKVMPDGTQVPFAAGLNEPTQLAFDSAGDLFAAGNGINEIASNGTQRVIAAGIYAWGLALDNAGDLFVGNFNSENILEFTNNNGTLNTNSIVFASLPFSPSTLAFNSAGDLFVSSVQAVYNEGEGNSYYIIMEISPQGAENDFVESGQLYSGIAFNSEGNLLAAQSTGAILEFTPGGVGTNLVNTGFNSPPFGIFGLAFQPPPVAPSPLNIAPAGNQVALFWPSGGAEFLLQSATNLNNPNWVTVTNGLPITGFMVTNTPPSQFFRLEQY